MFVLLRPEFSLNCSCQLPIEKTATTLRAPQRWSNTCYVRTDHRSYHRPT